MGTHYRGKPNERRALDLYIKLRRAADTLEANTNRRVRQSGLTESQFAVLEALLHLGPLQQRTISEKILKSGGNVTMVIDHLEERGLLFRQVNADDRRCVVVSLTEVGRELIGKIFPSHVAYIVETMSALSGEEQVTLAALCRKLGLSIAHI